FLRLLLGTHKHDAPAAVGEVAHEGHRLVELADGLLEIDDMDAVALREDEGAHARIPAPGLMPKVDAGLQQQLHRDRGSHGRSSLLRLTLRDLLPAREPADRPTTPHGPVACVMRGRQNGIIAGCSPQYRAPPWMRRMFERCSSIVWAKTWLPSPRATK